MTELPAAAPDILDAQPIEHVKRDGVEYVILGTAHVSRSSMEAVQAILERESFDAVAVELCDSRAQSMRDPEAFKHMDLFQVIRHGKTGMVAASLILASFQRRLAEQHGIEPGAEMRAGMTGAERLDLPLWLIDREVGTTLKRAWRNIGFGEKLGVVGGLLGSLFERDHIAEDGIEKLKQGDMLEGAFSEFAQSSESLYKALIAERDTFMAARLREEAAQAPDVRRVLVIIGAGHMKGMATQLRESRNDPGQDVAALGTAPRGRRWFKWTAMALVLAIFAIIIYAFHKNPSLGASALLDWVLYTGLLAALGAIIGGGHPLTALTSFIAAPLKPFRPGIPAGAIGALTEVWLRKPKVADFEALRNDITQWKGWWRNRVARIFVIFTLVNIGTIIGEYAAGIHIIHSLF